MLKQTLSTLLDIILPFRSDAASVWETSAAELLLMSKARSRDDFIALLPFGDERVKAAIHELKFHKNRRAVKLLATVLAQHVQTHSEPVVLVPVPLGTKRRSERGYNQVELVLTEVASRVASITQEQLLIRCRDTAQQTTLSRAERLTNMRDAFALNTAQAKRSYQNVHIVVVDDVATTGATLKAAKAALLPLKPKSITCLALAH